MDLEAEFKGQRMDNGKPLQGIKYELRQNQHRLRIQFIRVFSKFWRVPICLCWFFSSMLALSICAKGSNLYKRLTPCNAKFYLEAL
jgi:hypothetical protein